MDGDQLTCAVCGQPLPALYRTVGGRTLCVGADDARSGARRCPAPGRGRRPAFREARLAAAVGPASAGLTTRQSRSLEVGSQTWAGQDSNLRPQGYEPGNIGAMTGRQSSRSEFRAA